LKKPPDALAVKRNQNEKPIGKKKKEKNAVAIAGRPREKHGAGGETKTPGGLERTGPGTPGGAKKKSHGR